MILHVPKKARFLSLTLSMTDEGPLQRVREATTLCLMTETAPMLFVNESAVYGAQRRVIARARPGLSPRKRRFFSALAARREAELEAIQDTDAVKSSIGDSVLRIAHDDDSIAELSAVLQNRAGLLMFANQKQFRHRLPEAIRDRMAFSVRLDAPIETAMPILRRAVSQPHVTQEELTEVQEAVKQVASHCSEKLREKIVSMIRATWPDCEEFDRVNSEVAPELRQRIEFGLSPRAMMDVLKLAAAHALLEGRMEIDQSDLLHVFPQAVAHRIAPTRDAENELFDFIDDVEGIAQRALGE